MLLSREQDGASIGTYGDVVGSAVWPSRTCSPMGTLGWGCPIPPGFPPKPQPPTHGCGAERCQSCGSSQSHREEGSGLLQQQTPVPPSTAAMALVAPGALKPRRGPGWKEAGAKLQSGSCSPMCITLVRWHACVQVLMQMRVRVPTCERAPVQAPLCPALVCKPS